MKLCFISDTHNQHSNLKIPECDILFHTGDFTRRGMIYEVESFFNWLPTIPAKDIVFIAGNHDHALEPDLDGYSKDIKQLLDKLPSNICYLDTASTLVQGLKIWGSPWTPWFHDWAFNFSPGYDETPYWDKIPMDTEIVLTHGPCFGILDKVARVRSSEEENSLVGSKHLAYKIRHLKPKIYASGHIHEAYGVMQNEQTLYINASTCNLSYKPLNKPIIVELDEHKNIRSWGQYTG